MSATLWPAVEVPAAQEWIERVLRADVSDERPAAVIFDYDGTLCDIRGVRHYLLDGGRDFDRFHRASSFCPPNEDVVALAHAARDAGLVVLGVTARQERFRKVTAGWTMKHGVPVDALIMRRDGDYRPDYQIKSELLDTIEAHYRVLHAVDDNPNVLRLWRERGIEVTEVLGFEDVLRDG